LSFPSYEQVDYINQDDRGDQDDGRAPPSSPHGELTDDSSSPSSDDHTPLPTPEINFVLAEDDTAIKQAPSRHVDYLSHDWKEEDIWSSWKHIVSNRKVYGDRSRLENASWRTWAKQRQKLKTVPPDSLNWCVFLFPSDATRALTYHRLKDCDVTWLYGPLQPANHYTISEPTSEPTSNLSKSNSFLTKKPILKKRSMSEMMLQKSLSASSLVREAALVVQAQQNLSPATRMPRLDRRASDYTCDTFSTRSALSRDSTDYFSSRDTSGLQTPFDQVEKRHIRFDDKVEQCIAVEVRDGEFEEDDEGETDLSSTVQDDEDSSDEGVIMMRRAKKHKQKSSRSSSRRNSVTDTKIIAKLPSTTLKYRTDSPGLSEMPSHSISGTSWGHGYLSPSPSLETLRPPHPARNFLLEEDDDDNNDDSMSWAPAAAFGNRRYSKISSEESENPCPMPDEDDRFGGLRRTESGMFMPYEEDGEDYAAAGGLIGKVVHTVNTAKDIAHVIWNVGWRR
jgi:Fungal protein of unknown function (DUF1752)